MKQFGFVLLMLFAAILFAVQWHSCVKSAEGFDELKGEAGYKVWTIAQDTVNGTDTTVYEIPQVFGRVGLGTLSIRHCVDDTLNIQAASAGKLYFANRLNASDQWEITDSIDVASVPCGGAFIDIATPCCASLYNKHTREYQYAVIEAFTEADTLVRTIWAYWVLGTSIEEVVVP